MSISLFKSKSTSPKPKKPSAKILAAHELQKKIEQRAFELYEKRGCLSGFEMEDWLEAEKQIKEENKKKSKA